MTLSMVATQLLIPPERPGWVTRDRLLTRLEDGASSRLTVLSAPAGFGKTTLVASWLARSEEDRLVAWLSLDAADSDPAVFWLGVATAVRGATSRHGARPGLQLPTSSSPTDTAVPALLNHLAGTPGQVWLVLDDYHLADHHEVAVGMTYLVDRLPPNAHLVLTTRADPDLPLARWPARGGAGGDPCRRPALHTGAPYKLRKKVTFK